MSEITMKAVGEAEFTLPCGLLLDGQLHRTVKLTPMTGKDRKDAADPSRRNNAAKVATKILVNRVTAIGEIDELTEDHIRKLLAGDRDFLVMKLFEITHPESQFEAKLLCDKCKGEMVISVPYEEIKIIPMPEAVQNAIHAKGMRTWTFKSGSYHATFQYPTGAIQEIMAPRFMRNPIEGEYEMFARLMLDWCGGPSLTAEAVEELPASLVEALEDALVANTYGPDMAFLTTCESCGGEGRAMLDISNFLFKAPGTKRR